MHETPARRTLIVMVVIALSALAVIMAACGDGETDTTAGTTSSISANPSTDSTAAPDSADDGTTATSTERIVVDGESPDDYAAQIPELQKALETDPDNLETLQQLAIAQYNTSAYEEAATTYEKMLSLEDTAFSRNNYANVLRDWGKTDDAIANYETSISLDETLVTPYLNLASLLAQQDKVQEGITILENALASVGTDDQARVETYLEQLQSAE